MEEGGRLPERTGSLNRPVFGKATKPSGVDFADDGTWGQGGGREGKGRRRGGGLFFLVMHDILLCCGVVWLLCVSGELR
jgi:hypothetical protein